MDKQCSLASQVAAFPRPSHRSRKSMTMLRSRMGVCASPTRRTLVDIKEKAAQRRYFVSKHILRFTVRTHRANLHKMEERGIPGTRHIGPASRLLSAIRMRDAGRAFHHPLDNEQTSQENLVGFDSELDPYRSRNWPSRKKVTTVILYAVRLSNHTGCFHCASMLILLQATTTTSTFASSVFSTAILPIAEEFSISTVVATLGMSLFLIGFGIGPLLWAPLSEFYGRKTSILVPVFIGGCFAFGGGAAKDVQTIMICRFVSVSSFLQAD